MTTAAFICPSTLCREDGSLLRSTGRHPRFHLSCPVCGWQGCWTPWTGYEEPVVLPRPDVSRSWELSDWQRADLRLPS
jgi:hypothetical protein